MTPSYINRMICGDAREVLSKYAIRAKLIATSPPYADARMSTYGGVPPDKYVNWFLPQAEQIYESLEDDGTFILNIKEKTVNGERHTYVYDLVQALRKQGWLWTEGKRSHPV